MAELLSQLPPEMDVENLVLAASNQDQEEEEEGGSGAKGAGGWRGAGAVGVQAGRQADRASGSLGMLQGRWSHRDPHVAVKGDGLCSTLVHMQNFSCTYPACRWLRAAGLAAGQPQHQGGPRGGGGGTAGAAGARRG